MEREWRERERRESVCVCVRENRDREIKTINKSKYVIGRCKLIINK